MSTEHHNCSKHHPYLSIVLLCAVLLVSCATAQPTIPATPPPDLAKEIVFYDWFGDVPDNILDAFYNEYGVRVKYLAYESQEEAIDNMRQGSVYDVVVMDDRFITTLQRENLLAEINPANIPNLKNLSQEFTSRHLDPENHYAIPFAWGVTGLVINSKTSAASLNEWKELWNLKPNEKILIWNMPRETIGLALKALGYSVNSENPQELQEALASLIELKTNLVFTEDVSEDDSSCVPAMVNNFGIVSVSFSYDIWFAEQQDLSYISFVYPREGALGWADNFVIPANSPNKPTAEVFLNFLLRPEISAAVTIHNSYPTPNLPAQKYLPKEMLMNPVIFPETADMQKVETILPLSPEAEKLYEDIWTQFLEAETP